jgi:NADPH-dependent F420 reductase
MLPEPPCVAVLGGTGHHGRGLARRLAHAGARVIVGSRDPVRAGHVVATWSHAANIATAAYDAAIAEADVTILAVPFTSIDSILEEQRRHFRSGALVIDVTVPVTFSDGKLSLIAVPEGSATEHVRHRLSPGIRLAAAFKTVPAHLLEAGLEPLECDEFVCGDSDEARSEAAALVRMLPGVRPIDVGPLPRARSIEHLTALAIAINRRHKIHDARFRVVGL